MVDRNMIIAAEYAHILPLQTAVKSFNLREDMTPCMQPSEQALCATVSDICFLALSEIPKLPYDVL